MSKFTLPGSSPLQKFFWLLFMIAVFGLLIFKDFYTGPYYERICTKKCGDYGYVSAEFTAIGTTCYCINVNNRRNETKVYWYEGLFLE